MLSEIPTELYYEERTVFRREINNAGTCEMQLGKEIGRNIPSYVIIAFMVNDKFDSQRHDNFVFDWLPMSSAVCRLRSERYPDNFINFDNSGNIFQESYHGIENFSFKHTEDKVLIHFIVINSFRVIYNFYVIEISSEKDHIASQLISIEFKFYETGAKNVLDFTVFC